MGTQPKISLIIKIDNMAIKKKAAPKKKVAPKKAAAPAKKVATKKADKDEATGEKMSFTKTSKKGDTKVSGTLIRKLNYKGTEYFYIKDSDGKKRYMAAKFLDA